MQAPEIRVIPVTREDMRRPFMLHICKDGTISYRNAAKRERVFNGVALPVFSVETEEQAKAIQVRFGRRQYGEHPLMPGRIWYSLSRLPDGSDPALRDGGLQLEHLDAIGGMFKGFFIEHLVQRRFACCTVQRPDAGGTLYAPVDQYDVESGDTPSYDAGAMLERCNQLNKAQRVKVRA
jgi:hypothetical protein